jgi:hypothetical protein
MSCRVALDTSIPLASRTCPIAKISSHVRVRLYTIIVQYHSTPSCVFRIMQCHCLPVYPYCPMKMEIGVSPRCVSRSLHILLALYINFLCKVRVYILTILYHSSTADSQYLACLCIVERRSAASMTSRAPNAALACVRCIQLGRHSPELAACLSRRSPELAACLSRRSPELAACLSRR